METNFSGIVLLLTLAGLQRTFSPETLKAFMDIDKLKTICLELFKCKKSKGDKELD